MPQNLRYALLDFTPDVPQQPVQAEVYETFVSWGPESPKYKLLIVAAPLLIMLSTIAIILVAFYWAWPLQWTESNMSFDPMSIIHLIIACSNGEVRLGPLLFDGYDKKSVYDKSQDVTFRLSEIDVQRGREVLKVIEGKQQQ
jgi:hypothetical protein